ncbi:GIN domain-containing protein [Tanticharoenia sakaeratensis]|uniref:Putative auto-transporter adhesin head GIN domain-containing protein n=1 Tax=Tanticharoenia sakaeratensis NBRC 103193 TaxID=1231623 RepID=A0A0D6MKG2_9PROT|nr:DUF2807 domain-containing protein [Tanticharoenia sakaeratensis]GAN54169.1 hypothetical protein Tasa_017_052 [Tanticharoenia sakaeratensis NBRC 103193]GBQ19389.1 hypothetical protein AA103193_1012 [Tanticharoenia sakaeratensis NBRC 103193]
MKRGAAALSGLALGITAVSAHAAERQFDLSGSSIVFGSPCAREVIVTPSAIVPAGHVRIVATGDRQADLDRLASASGAAASFGASETCPEDNRPRTLHVEVQLPTAMPITVRDAGAETYRLGAFSAPLTVDTKGSTDVMAEAATQLTAKITGSGDVRLGMLDGPADIDTHGSGDVSISTVKAPSVMASQSGSGGLTIGRATVDHMTLDHGGSGDVQISDAAIGTLSARNGGSGDITIAGGRIETVTLDSGGSSDVSVAAAIGTLRLAADGSGSITLPHVARRESVRTSSNVSLNIGP